MVFLFEEIAVEAAMVIATIAAMACLLIVLVGFALQRRALRTASTRDTWRVERSARSSSSFTPTHS
jgi:hypothetical protein